MIRTAGIMILSALCLQASAAGAKLEHDPDGLVRVDTRVSADSVTVGERFGVVHAFSFPDSLAMLLPEKIDAGNCRVISQGWKEDRSAQGITRTEIISLMTLDLEAARVPEAWFDFRTPAGDTIRVFTRDVEIPVRHLAAQSQALAPLKQQWEAPVSWWVWALSGASALALAALAWYFFRRRRRVAAAYGPPALPADHVALTELARIEKLGLVEQGEYKRYYTLVLDTLRHYLERRYRIDAMDRTSDELLDELARRGITVATLRGLLGEADLVKFAKHVPGSERAGAAIESARDIVVKTRPRPVSTTGTGTGGHVSQGARGH